MKRPLILLVDDEPVVLRALRVALEAQDYAVSAVLTGEDALERISNGAFDLVLLDLGLPGVDGFEVIRRVRVLYPALPIIVLSAQGEDAVKVEALDLGADDYVSKPFSVRELLARVRVALRHSEAAEARAGSTHIERGVVSLDLAEHTARVRGEPVQLTRTQFALLACFARHPGRLLTHRAIVTEVWGDPDAAAADNLRVQISQLRRRIELDPRHPQLIVTEPGLGYRFLDDHAGDSQEP
jgi:two-component system KDP operon response regulator KdpE